MRAITIILTMLFLTLTLGSASAGEIMTPVATDKMMTLLNSLFGSLGVFGGQSSDPLLGVIKVINSSALICCGVLASYIILAGIAGTAHDGEMLGKKFSSLWLPLKFSGATALILPAINGYTVLQKIVASIIAMGIGMGDFGATEFMSKQNLVQTASASLIQPETKNLAYNLFASYACMNMLKIATKDNNSSVLYGNASIGVSTELNNNKTVYLFGSKEGAGGIPEDACGKLEVSNWQVPASASNNSLVGISEAIPRMKVIVQENLMQTNILMQKMDELSAKMIAEKKPINPMEIENAMGAYRQAVDSVASREVLSLDQFSQLKKSVDQDGFIFLGAYYSKITKLIDLVNSSIATVPVATGVTRFPVPALADQWQPVFEQVAKTVNASGSGLVNYGLGNEAGGSNTSWFDSIKASILNGFDGTVILKKVFTSSSKLMFDDKENIMLKIERIGGWALALASAGLAGVGVASATLGTVSSGIAFYLCSTMLMVCAPLMIFGFTCLYVIPMLPYLIWMGCILAYLLTCVEALLGSSLWLIGVFCEGHEIMGQAQNGFKQLVTLLFKPVLMVAGFACSVVVLEVFGQLLNSTFADTWNLSQSDSGFFTYLLGMLAAPFMYVVVATTIIKTCFNIVHTLPDGIMQLIGGFGGALGGHAKEVSGSVATGASAVGVGLATKSVTNSLQRGLNTDRLGKNIGENLKSSGSSINDEVREQHSEHIKSELVKSEPSSLQGQRDNKLINDAVGLFGGAGSLNGHKFMETLQQTKQNNPGVGLDRAVASAVNKQLNESYGSGVGRLVGLAGKGDYTSPKAVSMLETVQQAREKLDIDMGLNDFEIKNTLSQSSKEAMKKFEDDDKSIKHGGTMEAKDFFVKSVNNNLDKEFKFDNEKKID